MSVDERQHMDNDEIDLAGLFRTIWFHKFSLLIVIILSIPMSIIVATNIEPTYKAETVFEKPSDSSRQSNTSLLSGMEGMGILSILGGSPFEAADNSFYSEIRSESFLKTVILNNTALDAQKLKEFCPLPSVSTPRLSLKSLLIFLRLSENKNPSESQKISLLVECVNDMLEIDFDNYGSGESSAYRLSIESGDPYFSASLANQIVEKYFIRHEEFKDKNLQNVKKYLSKVISEAQLEFTEANKLMQSFIIKHTLLMNIQPSALATNDDVSLPLPPSPFAAKLKKDFFSLSQLEKSLSQLKQANSNLSNLKEPDQESIKLFITSTELQGALSRRFVTSISRIDNLFEGISFKNQEIKKLVSEELRRLEQQIQVLEEKIGKREEQTIQLMTVENRFQELAIDVSKKKLIFEGLKDQLKEKILTSGLANIEQPVLLTKAVPPFDKSFPNKKLILVLGIVLSLFAGIAYILFRQLSLRRVHSLSQLEKISRFINCYGVKYKQLKLMAERSDKSIIGQSFFSDVLGVGKLGCVIDLSQKNQNNSLASEFSKTIVSLLAANNLKIVCMDTLTGKKPFSAVAQNNFESELSKHNVQEASSRNISSFNYDNAMISAGETNKIKNKYSDYDKIICVLDAEIGDLTKFNYMEQCDFYILIGKSFCFDEYTYKNFSNTEWEKEKKCLGFFLID